VNAGYRGLALIAAALISIVALVPSVITPPSWWPWKDVVRQGLDLQGGTHLLYGVEIDKAVEASLDRLGRDVERELRDAQVGAFTVDRNGETIEVKLSNDGKRAEVRELLQTRIEGAAIGESAAAGGADLTLTLTAQEVQRIRGNVVEQALKIMRNRIDEFGVTEPTLQSQGTDEIVVQLPGIQDPQRAKDLIGRTALLEFKLLAQGASAGTLDAPGPGVEVLWGSGDAGSRERYLVEKRPIMTGEVITDAQVRPGSATEGMVVDFVLDSQGGRVFGETTRTNVGRNLAIVLDGFIESAPVIREAITGGRGQISGRFEFAEAQDLANVLRNGALPAPLTLREERTVGPSLGRDSIRQGTLSFIVGGAIIVLFMVVYYRMGGLIADLALVVNVLLIMGAFALFGFTLTLPGIAGIVLTLGMAVDANVLILERIREELRLGRSPRAAVEAGYEKAWSAILDSNATTFLSGLILFQFGSGPVRGFAVTLCLGIVTSMVTGVFGTRVVYDWLGAHRRLTTVSV